MYYFIVNPNAGDGKGAARWMKIMRRLDKTGLRYEVMITERRGDARSFARYITEHSTGEDVVVAVGGDGTINEVVDGLVFDGSVTLGYIPTGIHNSLAKCLGLKKNTKKYLKSIENPQDIRILDYGVLTYGEEVPEHRRFAVVCGIGLSELLQSDPVKGYILLDGVKRIEFNRIFLISARIYTQEKKRFLRKRRAPATGVGTMEVCIAHGASRLRLLPIFAAVWRDRNSHRRGMRRYACRDLEIHLDQPLPVYVDGEICNAQTDITINCVKKKIRMIV